MKDSKGTNAKVMEARMKEEDIGGKGILKTCRGKNTIEGSSLI
jgi:hypothetical protein